MSTPVVRIDHISKRFVIRKEKSLKERVVNFGRSNLHKDDFWALRDVDITINSGETVGLIGPNGSGKSTLLKMVGGILQPTSGAVSLRGRLAALLELGAGFHPDLTGRENVYLNASILGLTRHQTDGYFDAIVDFSGIEPFIDTQVKFYSSGMYVRLAFAVAVHVDPDILLVDEVLAVGDEPFQRKCMDRIRGFQAEGRTIVLVTHALDQVAELCDRAIVLDHGVVQADGPPIEALRVLRNEFEQTRREDIERARTSSDEPAPRATVDSVELFSEGAPVADIPTGAPLTVRTQVTSDTELANWAVAFGIETAHGQTIFATSSRMLGHDLPPLKGSATFEFTVEHTHVGEGSYTVPVWLIDGSGAEVHRLVGGASLGVHSDGSTLGVVQLQTSLGVVQP